MEMRRRTQLALGPTLLVLLAAAGCILSPQQKEAKFLQSGKQYLLRRDYARAALQFKNAARVMPRDTEAYYQLGIAELDGGKLTAAVSALRKATELDPKNAAAQVKLAQLMALSGVKDVEHEGERQMQDVLRGSPNNVDALDALALNEAQLGKWQDAEAHLQRALEKSPQSVKSAVALARIDLARHDLKAAKLVLKKAVAAVPRSPEAATALGELYLIIGEPDKAQTEFRAAIKIDRKFALALVGLASAQIRLGHRDQAEQTYHTLSALSGKKYRYMYAAYLFSEGKRDSAIKEFEELMKQYPDDRTARSDLVTAYLLMGRVQDAQNVVNTALQKNPNDVDALLQQSQVLVRSGKPEEAQSDLIQVLRYRPDSARARFLLAKVYGKGGDSLRQRQELNAVLRLKPSFLEARLELARNLMKSNSARAALDNLDAAPDQQKQVLAFIIQRNWVLLDLNREAEARKAVDRALSVIRVPDLLIQDAVLKFRQREYAAARVSANEALAQNPENVKALSLVATSYEAQKEPADARRALRHAAEQYPKSAAIQQLLGEWLLSKGDLTDARAALNAAKAADPSFTAADMLLARLDVKEGKLGDARKAVAHVLSLDPANAEAHLWLGTIETQSGEDGAAIEQFRKVLDTDDANVAALNNLAYLMATFANKPDEALPYAQRACELAPDSADAEGTLGWVLYRKGLYEMAFKYLQKAVGKDGKATTPNAAIRKYHLGETYLKLGDRKSGRDALQDAFKMDPSLARLQAVN